MTNISKYDQFHGTFTDGQTVFEIFTKISRTLLALISRSYITAKNAF